MYGSRYDDAASTGILETITYPNGFMITVSSDMVTTNTGFQLKYVYVDDQRPMDPGKTDVNSPYLPQQSPGQWAAFNPKYIKAINNAYEYCAPLATYSPSRTWPTATFNWPGGMPMLQDRSTLLGIYQ